MISLQCFGYISVQISPNNKNLDIFKIYTKWAVEKCPRWNFYAYRKPRNSKTKVYTVLLDTLQIPLDNMDKLNSIFFVQCQLGMNYIVVCYFHKYVIHRKLCNSTYIFNIISFPNFWSKESGVPRFFVGAPVNFRLIRFFDPSTPSMRKVDTGKRKETSWG